MTEPRSACLLLLLIALAACGGGGGGAAAPPANRAPMANAGADQTVDERSTVTLDGSASSDSDGQIARYAWSQTAGTTVSLSDAAVAAPTFTAPSLSTAVDLTFRLEVTDDDGATATDTVTVTVNPVVGLNDPPVADGGGDQTVAEQSAVTLDGSASADADGSIQTFAWTQVAGPDVTLANGNTATASFDAPAVAVVTELTFQLTVTDNEGATDTVTVTVTVTGSAGVVISGRVTYDRVPHTVGGTGLDYSNTMQDPIRGVTVQLIHAGDGITELAATVSDASGDYALSAPPATDVFLRVRAELMRSGAPSWQFRVVDNTANDALYVLDGSTFNSGGADQVRNLNAASGWGGAGYTSARAAAPFSIIDTVYQAVQLVLSADATVSLPPLDLHWSENNVPAEGSIQDGLITTTFYSGTIGGGGIFILGDENNDTDEYDQHVIAHEWGHYFEFQLSRSDSIGGAHGPADQLDLRLAYGEGFGNAFAAMVKNDSIYQDSLDFRQSGGFSFDVEGEDAFWPASVEGWFSEGSVQEILYDLFDGAQDIPEDSLALGFDDLYAVLTNQQVNTPALTSIFSVLDALKSDLPARAAEIDALAGVESIDPIQDAYGSGETNAGNPASADVLPIYKTLTVGGGAVEVCSLSDFGSNGLGVSAFLRVDIPAAGSRTVRTTPTVVPPGQEAAPRIVFHQVGQLTNPLLSPAATNLAVGEAVIEVYERSNSEGGAIGRTCFDVTIQ